MDIEIEELESLYSGHFGRTPVASQNDSDENDNDDSNDDWDRRTVESVADDRLRDFADRLDEDRLSDANLSEDEDGVSNDQNSLECDDDLLKARQFVGDGCSCRQACHKSLSAQNIYEHVLLVREMSKEEKDMYVMGSILTTGERENTKRGKKRKRIRSTYTFAGKSVCKQTFMFAYNIGRCALETLVSHCKESGPTPRRHGNLGKKPKHALVFDDIRRVVDFLTNFADENGIPQPAAPRGSDNIPPVYLSSELTKLEVHKRYGDSCREAHVRAVKQTAFCDIWNACLGHIKIASPRDDVCATCEKSRQLIVNAVEENEKLEATAKFRDHILQAQKERYVYNDHIKLAKSTSDQDPETRFSHYTFDFSQNVAIPHFCRQMGPIYFTTLRKIQIFGVRIDGTPKQLSFLIDENETIGCDGKLTHGPNAVISMLHWVLETYGRGESACSLHADNCAGQNKNRYVIGYFMWRDLTGRHRRIDYLMQIPGHGRCLVDNGFGYLKKLYRRSDCETLDKLETIVNKSSATNEAVRYPVWNWRDWKGYLTPLFKAVTGIRKYQYFKMSSDEPGLVTVKTGADDPEVKVNILIDAARVTEQLPPIIHPQFRTTDIFV